MSWMNDPLADAIHKALVPYVKSGQIAGGAGIEIAHDVFKAVEAHLVESKRDPIDAIAASVITIESFNPKPDVEATWRIYCGCCHDTWAGSAVQVPELHPRKEGNGRFRKSKCALVGRRGRVIVRRNGVADG